MAALYHGTLAENWKVISIVGVVAVLILLALRLYLQFPIITVKHGILKLEVFWEKWEIDCDSIRRILKKRGFAAKPVLGNLLHFPRPYWRIEIHYFENKKEKDIDIDLTQFHKREIEEFLAVLKRLRPDLDIPPLDKRGL